VLSSKQSSPLKKEEMIAKIIISLSLVLMVLVVGCEPKRTDQGRLEDLIKQKNELNAEWDAATATALANTPKVTLTNQDVIVATMGYAAGEQQIARGEHSHTLFAHAEARSYTEDQTEAASSPACRLLVFENWAANSFVAQGRQWWQVSATVKVKGSGYHLLGTLQATWRVDDRTITVLPATFTFTNHEGEMNKLDWPC
jgi:hypothetical protein